MMLRSGLSVIALAVLITLLWILTGVQVITALGFTALIAWQSVAGLVVWHRIRPDTSLLERMGMALALGTALASLAGLMSATLGLGPWGSILPSALALALVVASRRQHHAGKPSTHLTQNRPELLGFIVAMASGLAVFLYALRQYPVRWSGSWTGYHPDMPFFEALGNSLARFGLLESPFMSGGVVRYHGLSYAWSGQLSVITNAEPFLALTRVLPVVTLLGSAAIVVAWTSRLTRVRWAPTLAGLLLTLSGFTGAVYGGVVTMDSPSQAMAVLWLLAFTILVVEVAQRSETAVRALIGPLILIFVMAIALTGGKVSAAAPALAGTLLMVAVLRVKQRLSTPLAFAILGSALVGAGLAIIVFLTGSVSGGGLTIGALIDRASSQQGLNPLDGPRGVILGTLILTLAILPRWAGLIWLIMNPRWRWRAETWLSIGMAASSIVALLAFNSFNEIWFSSTVSGPLAVMTAVGVGLASRTLTRHQPTRAIPLLAVTAAAALGIFLFVWWLWLSGASGGNIFVATSRWLGPLVAWIAAVAVGIVIARWVRKRWSVRASIAAIVMLLVFTSVPGRLLGIGSGQVGMLTNGARGEWFSITKGLQIPSVDREVVSDWTSSRMDAATWLRENTDPDALLATNITIGPFVAGVTLRPTYASGLLYQVSYGTPAMEAELLQREQQSWAFIDDPSPNTVQPLCEAGVRWIWIDRDRTETRDWAPFADITFQSDDTLIASVPPEACAADLP